LAEHPLAECVRLAYARAWRATLINVFESNAPAIAIYRRLGFRDVVVWRRGSVYPPG
jgi:ribosomal protein S18 acetylase RimI-like enzyme